MRTERELLIKEIEWSRKVDQAYDLARKGASYRMQSLITSYKLFREITTEIDGLNVFVEGVNAKRYQQAFDMLLGAIEGFITDYGQ